MESPSVDPRSGLEEPEESEEEEATRENEEDAVAEEAVTAEEVGDEAGAAEEAEEESFQVPEEAEDESFQEVQHEDLTEDDVIDAEDIDESVVESEPNPEAAEELDFRKLEAQAARVVHDVQAVAQDVSKKLSEQLWGAMSAVSTSTAAAATGPAAASSASSKAAGATPTTLSGLTSGLSTWWNSLDPMPAPKRDEMSERVSAANKASGELQTLFGLSPEENLVEEFKCKLLQTYACNHNSLTPAIQMAFQGTMYITDHHTCFSVEERGRKMPFKVPHTSVVSSTRQRPPMRGDLSDILRLERDDGTSVAFKDFENGGALDSALALIEHLVEGA